MLGASAVQTGTGLLRCPELKIPSAWSEAIKVSYPDRTILTRAFTGRLGRSYKNEYAAEASSFDAPLLAPYPMQRALTAGMTAKARKENDLSRMQAWTGQSGKLAQAVPAYDLANALWSEAVSLLFGDSD